MSIYSFTIGSLVMSQFQTSTPLPLLLAGSLLVSQLSPLPQVLDELLAPPSLGIWDPQFFDSLDGVCEVGSPY